MRFIDTIVIHSSATPPSMDIGFAEINQWHLNKGWDGIGYHFVIRRDGTIEYGRDVDILGAGVANQNTGKIHIVYVGGIDNDGQADDNRTIKQIWTMRRLIKSLQVVFGYLTIVGHRDLANTECPSFDAKIEFKEL